MKNRLFAYVIAFFMAFQPMLASAADLNAAFTNLLGPGAAVSVNEPGRYQSGARNSFIAGGLEMRVPRSTNVPQLFSVTPPRITAGCGGISAHFGGFSFISGAEFEALLQSIASGAALGFVSMLVLKTLCPQCEAVVQFLKTLAQQAARLAKNSCEFGKNLAQSFLSGMGGSQGSPETVCGTTVSAEGGSADFLSAVNDACKSVTSAVDSLLGVAAESGNPESQDSVKCKVGAGNQTWQRLRVFDSGGLPGSAAADESYKRRIILMNLLGAELGVGGEDTPAEIKCDKETIKDGPNEATPVTFCPPRLEVDVLMGYFMCGVPTAPGTYPGDPGNSVKAYCDSYFTKSASLPDTKLYFCGEDKVNCSNLTLESASALVGGTGFLTNVNKTLLEGVTAVRNNTVMPEEVIKLVQVAPYPLYQAINAAAVYPAAAADLIDAMSILVAEQAALSYLDESLRLSARAGGKATCLTEPQARQIMEAVGSMRSASRARRSLIAQNVAIQEALTEQIRQLNIAIQRQTLTQDMLTSNQVANSLNRTITTNNGAGDTPSEP